MRVGCRECGAPEIRVKATEGAEDLNVQASKNSPAYGARNAQIVAAGTGEALPGRQPAERVAGARRSITSEPGK